MWSFYDSQSISIAVELWAQYVTVLCQTEQLVDDGILIKACKQTYYECLSSDECLLFQSSPNHVHNSHQFQGSSECVGKAMDGNACLCSQISQKRTQSGGKNARKLSSEHAMVLIKLEDAVGCLCAGNIRQNVVSL